MKGIDNMIHAAIWLICAIFWLIVGIIAFLLIALIVRWVFTHLFNFLDFIIIKLEKIKNNFVIYLKNLFANKK